MRAVDIRNGTGPADALFLNDNVETPKLKSGDVLVKVKAFGLNRMDLVQREGHYPLPPQAPSTLGVEFSGTVDSLGDGVTSFKKGDEVFGLAYGGAYAEYIAVSEKMCIHKPSSLSWEKAAGVPETWITATQALYKVGGFKAGDRVLIHAGASGVGIAGIQLAVQHGAKAVYTTTSSQEKLDFCTKELGATAAFNYKTENFAEKILEATDGQGVDLIIDMVGQSHFQKNIQCAAKDAKIVILAFMSGAVIENFNIAPILFKRLRIEGSTLRSRDVEYQKELRDKIVEEALPGIESGKMHVYVDKTFKWEDVVEAHKYMESNQSQGKIICTIG